MNQKDFLLKLLNKLSKGREYGEKLYNQLVNNKISDEDTQNLIDILTNHINEVYNETKDSEVLRAKSYLDKIKEKESFEKQVEDKELEEMEKRLEE